MESPSFPIVLDVYHYTLDFNQVNMENDLPMVINGAPCTSWSKAELRGTLQYLRGCKSLDLQPEFRSCFPEVNWGIWDDPMENRMVG